MDIKDINKEGYVTLVLVIIAVGVLVFFAGFYDPQTPFGEKSVEVAFPYTFDVSANTSFACTGILYAGVEGDSAEYLTNGIKGSVTKSDQTLALQIQDENTLAFMTGTAIEVGETNSVQFAILHNDDTSLTAAQYDDYSRATNVLTLNKTNGLAIWSKTSPDFLISDGPFGQMYYLECI